ncbi:MAG: hypothetical protein ACJ77M_14150, partial [Thermoleophilaceae bacterium]
MGEIELHDRVLVAFGVVEAGLEDGRRGEVELAVEGEAPAPITGDKGRRLALEGELDLATAPILQASFDDAERDHDAVTELDLTELQFV